MLEGSSRLAGKAHPSLIVLQVLDGNASFPGKVRQGGHIRPLFGAGDKNRSFSC